MQSYSRFQLGAKKALGQHFLTDQHTIDCIIDAVNLQPNDHVIEIGPGRGALTLPLLRQLHALTVVELDRDLILPLAHIAKPHGTLNIIHDDVLRLDFTAFKPAPLRLVGNLPYNLSSPILFHTLSAALAIQDMHFMLQKEVVERMASLPSSKVYGRLSVMLQAKCIIEPLFTVPPEAFSPPPKVDSAVVRLTPLPDHQISVQHWEQFSLLVRAAFSQRRKTLRNALRHVCTAEQFKRAGVDPGARAEDLDVHAFAELSNAISV